MPEDLGDVPRLGQRPGVHSARVQEGPAIHTAKIIVGKVENADADLLGQHALRRVPPRMGRAGLHQGQGARAVPALRAAAASSASSAAPTRACCSGTTCGSAYNGKPSMRAGQLGPGGHPPLHLHPAGRAHQRAGRGQVPLPQQARHLHARHAAARAVQQAVRAFSHGCMRVQNPGRLAEMLLEEDKGWSAAHVRGCWPGGNNNEVDARQADPGARHLLHGGGRRRRPGEATSATSTATTSA